MIRMMTDQELRDVLRADKEQQPVKVKKKSNVIELRSWKNER